MPTPILHYPARSRVERSTDSYLSRQRRPPWAAAQVGTGDAAAQAVTGRRAVRTGACVGAAIVGGIGLAAGSVVLAVSWLLAVETRSGELWAATGWAASVTTLGVVAGGIAGGVVGAFVAVATRVVRRAHYDKPARERMKVA